MQDATLVRATGAPGMVTNLAAIRVNGGRTTAGSFVPGIFIVMVPDRVHAASTLGREPGSNAGGTLPGGPEDCGSGRKQHPAGEPEQRIGGR